MTLHELIEMAGELGVDFDALVSVPHQDAIDVHYLEKGSNGGLVIRIF
jgi:hypothetical protein